MTALLAATPYGRSDGSSRVRVFEWLDRLDLPAEVVVAMPDGRPATAAGWLDLARRSAAGWRRGSRPGEHTLWLHREVSPLSPGALERSMISHAGLALFDLDDALFVEPERSARSLLLRRRAKAELCARRADVVVAGNEFIAEWAASLGARPEIVPSCVDPSVYVPKDDYELGAVARIVWVGSSSTLPHLRAIVPALEVVRRHRPLELVVIGPVADATGPGGASWPTWVRWVPWSEAAVQRELAHMDVGVMPLPELPYERGKCAYKLLQYGAAGLPTIGSPVGVNASILGAMGAASPVTRTEWVDALSDVLSASADERRRLGQRAAEVVAGGYTFDRWRPQMRSLLQTGRTS